MADDKEEVLMTAEKVIVNNTTTELADPEDVLFDGETMVEFTNGGFYISTSRSFCGDVFEALEHCAGAGRWPAGLTAFDVGRALQRLLTNCPDEKAPLQVMRGMARVLKHQQDMMVVREEQIAAS